MGLFGTKKNKVEGERPIVVFTAGRNCAEYAERCITSVLDQKYDNYRHIVVDDDSTDGTGTKITEFAGASKKHELHLESERRLWTGNAYHFCTPRDDEIVVTLDLDDWLAHDRVLSTVNELHQAEDCWLTYGSYKHASDGKRSNVCKPFPSKVLKDRSFREYKWVSSHLRSFRGFLWNALDKDTALRGEDGEWGKMAYDLGIMMPMLEMCPPGKIRFVREPLYVYNDFNPLQEHKIDRDHQIRVEQYFRSLPKVEVLERASV